MEPITHNDEQPTAEGPCDCGGCRFQRAFAPTLQAFLDEHAEFSNLDTAFGLSKLALAEGVLHVIGSRLGSGTEVLVRVGQDFEPEDGRNVAQLVSNMANAQLTYLEGLIDHAKAKPMNQPMPKRTM